MLTDGIVKVARFAGFEKIGPMGRLPIGAIPGVRIVPPCRIGNRATITAHPQKRRENPKPMEPLKLSLEEVDASGFCLTAELVFR
jgi:hypothetical protein